MGVSTVTSAGSRDPEIPALGSYVSREGSHRWGGGALAGLSRQSLQSVAPDPSHH